MGWNNEWKRNFARLGYEYYKFVEDEIRPETSNIKFKDILPQLARSEFKRVREIAECPLYKHQLKALKALEKGFNVILRSGTGSGKTEAWLLFSLKNNVKTLALYPTLALANDQINRIEAYAKTLGITVEKIDSERRLKLLSEYESPAKVRRILSKKLIIITNPAFLLCELKRYVDNPRMVILSSFIKEMRLLVIDELDFYGPREISLLLAMIELLKTISMRTFQVAILTATLGNPEELVNFLREVTGRNCIIVEGPPSRPKNEVYLILGKNIKEIYRQCYARKSILDRYGLGKLVSDYETFKRNMYFIINFLRSLGEKIPNPEINMVEILKAVYTEPGLTLVFTNSINEAEILAKRLKSILPESERSKVAVHHHLIPRDVREKIEKDAREGRIKILISPKTLMQGIDIGTITRIVHIGLPQTLREFLQREGRKGRRLTIRKTESIIIPRGRWDRELLARGIKVFIEWLKLPLERTIANPANKYKVLFTSLFKARSPYTILGSYLELSNEERSLLLKLHLIDEKGHLTEEGERIWRNLNFYELAPPIGVRRRIKLDGKIVDLEPTSRVDALQKYQVGCIDYPNEAIVIKTVERRNVIVDILEKPLTLESLLEHPELYEAYLQYEKVKEEIGEEPDIVRDLKQGKLTSQVILTATMRDTGFTKVTYRPFKIIWIVEGEKYRTLRYRGKVKLVRIRRRIELPVAGKGTYTDYTYAYALEYPVREEIKMIRIGLATLKVFLREKYGIPLNLIAYDIVEIGKPLIILVETSSSGIIEILPWSRVKHEISQFQLTPIREILLLQADQEAYQTLVEEDIDWNKVIEISARIAETLARTMKVKMEKKRKPSKKENILSLHICNYKLEDQKLTVVTVYNGSKLTVVENIERLEDIIAILNKALRGELKIATVNIEDAIRELSGEYPVLSLLLKKAYEEKIIIDLSQRLSEYEIKRLKRYLLKIHNLTQEYIKLKKLGKREEQLKILGKIKRNLIKYSAEYAKIIYSFT